MNLFWRRAFSAVVSCPVAICAVVTTPACLADNGKQAQMVVADAIRVLGGKEALAKCQNCYLHGKGTLTVGGKSVPMTFEYWRRRPNQLKCYDQIGDGGMRTFEGRLLNGKKGWMGKDAKFAEANDTDLKGMQVELYKSYVTSLYPLLEDPQFQLTYLGESLVNDKKAVGVRISSEGQKDIAIFFDRITRLPVKVQGHNVNMNNNKQVLVEQYPSGFTKVMGAMYAMKMVMMVDGKKYMEGTILEIRPLREGEERVFEKLAP